jgi:hypothetical protein
VPGAPRLPLDPPLNMFSQIGNNQEIDNMEASFYNFLQNGWTNINQTWHKLSIEALQL